ncbi:MULTISPECIES: FHA domain-containing protein [unclassified Pseudoclavibacter]|uniref:FHA domain-containing protein n=1 Tax=unclassified Pseudoclavibacter TaxID=2615177 RepID=UPI001300FB47|nr:MULTISPECIES: FHA domain-containing protein [unclassified Pseudoclavibacter]KAB1646475.1 FHA domain-containing protein [Pseudoclavibacter sp. CFCC 14310]KAB1658176.1 FHA domain-containing protein [Pseudoclavibacter sp. CFCC 11306]KAB1661914.1 FHA domain-containing protein [Pseudoclavibacter sp. CFCC 13796]KAB1663365.1 FHA domain-containing protein [Pseudoclavibacter sp. CFCC 13611]
MSADQDLGQQHPENDPQEPATRVQPVVNLSTEDETLTFTGTFAQKLLATGAIQIGVGTEELEAIASLPAGSALLIVRQGPNVGSRFLLDSDVVTVGRHPHADIFLDDVTVSRRHAEFRRTGTGAAVGYDVVDLGSLNGTYLNGTRIESAHLEDGAEVQIGKFRLTYYPSRRDLLTGENG